MASSQVFYLFPILVPASAGLILPQRGHNLLRNCSSGDQEGKESVCFVYHYRRLAAARFFYKCFKDSNSRLNLTQKGESSEIPQWGKSLLQAAKTLFESPSAPGSMSRQLPP